MWSGEQWHQQTSFTYRFIICKLQTCFILHCSFAEVNSWGRQTERLLIKRGLDPSLLTVLSGPAFIHLILSTAHLNCSTNYKGHLTCVVWMHLFLHACLHLTFDVFPCCNHPFISLLTDHNVDDSLYHSTVFIKGHYSRETVAPYRAHSNLPERFQDYSRSEHWPLFTRLQQMKDLLGLSVH